MRTGARLPLVAGVVLLFLAVGVLVTSPAAFVGTGATFIDHEGYMSSGEGVPVATDAYVRSADQVEEFPESFGPWNQTRDVTDEWGNVKNTFRADALKSAYYAKPGLYTPAHLFIITSEYTRVLHSLPASYGLQGYEPQERDVVRVNMTGEDWVSEDSPNRAIPVNEMTFTRKDPQTGNVTDKRLVHFYWVIREGWGVTDHMTWVGTNLPVPKEGNTTGHARLLANFTADVTDQLFVPEASDTPDTVAAALLNESPQGPLLLGGSVGVPLLLIAYGLLAGRLRGRRVPASRRGGSPPSRAGDEAGSADDPERVPESRADDRRDVPAADADGGQEVGAEPEGEDAGGRHRRRSS